MKTPRFPYKTPYGHFSDDGRSFVITRPDTPRPWVNVMSTGTYGVALAQTGSGYSWLNHASLNRITRWNQDLIRDDWGRYLYIRDDITGEFWSAGWQPVQAKWDFYECIHGVGYTQITSRTNDVQVQWFVFVPHEEPLEIWRVRVKNLAKKPRRLSLWTYLEWNLGESPDWHREFHRTFIETSFHDGKIILARKRLSPLKNARGQNWNRTWDHVAFHGVNLPTRALSGDKEAFLGRYGSLQSPAALREGQYVGRTTHKWDDAIASLCVPLSLKPGQEQSALFTVGAADSDSQALIKARQFQNFDQMERVWHRTEIFWDKYLTAFPVRTPEPAFNVLTNTWLRYQALSARLWGRTAYYQTGGAFGFRDQLQDSQIFLPMDAERTRQQIRLHAAHQFADGTAYHWWHPLSEEGHPSKYSDDLLWLPFVIVNYLKETGNWNLLSENVPFAPKPGEKRTASTSSSLFDHAVRAIDKSLTRLSRRGLPLIGEGDWNDGLSGAGIAWKGESVWMGHFLYGILNEWSDLIDKALDARALPAKEKQRARNYRKAAGTLKRALNRHAWDGQWFFRATCDDGSVLGSHRNREGKIFLNAQTWALLNGVVDSPARKTAILRSLEKYLYGPHGPLLLAPAYSVPDERVGYLTRYSPTTRENGGIYFHAAVWALQMECRLGRAKKAWDLYRRMNPVLRGAAEPDLYRCEPYVTPGNVDGPGSPTPGRGGWTWYTGSAAWLFRISTEWFLGIRPEWDGLRVHPCLPPDWNEASAERVFRGGTYRIRFVRDPRVPAGSQVVFLNGERLSGDLLPIRPGRSNGVEVRVGPAR
jgi:cellobiose phosphorylase